MIRTKGYSATSVDELCAAADHWSETIGARFADAPYHDHAAPLDRLLGYLEFRKARLQGGVPEFTCLVGTMVQETYETTPAIREACERSIIGHAANAGRRYRSGDARAEHGTRLDGEIARAAHTGRHPGAFILARATGGAEIAADSIDHLIRYLELLFLPDS